jgi:hypothetical protein
MTMTRIRSDRALTNDQIARFAPSVFATEAHSSRSDEYSFIPTSTVLAGLQREGFGVYEASQSRTRFADKRFFTKHMLRLRPMADVPYARNTEVPEIILTNSHDGTSAYKVMAGYFRFVCANGLVVGTRFADFRVRHTSLVVDNVIEGVFSVVSDLRDIDQRISAYKSIELSPGEQADLAERALRLRWDEQAPIQSRRLLEARRWDDRQNDLWSVFNRVQEGLVKGGVRGYASTGRRLRTREVTSIDEGIKLNRGLWSLVDEIADRRMGVAA